MNMRIKRQRNRSQTITRTFRIQQEWVDVLEEEAESQGMSVNALLNKILRKYALFTRWTDGAKFQSFSPQMFQRIIEELSEDSLAKVGATLGASDVVYTLNIMGRPLDYESFIELMVQYFGGSDFCRWYSCFHHVQGNQDVFHLQHNLGRKWSIFLEKYLLSGISSIAEENVDAKIYDFAVNIKITSPKTKSYKQNFPEKAIGAATYNLADSAFHYS